MLAGLGVPLLIDVKITLGRYADIGVPEALSHYFERHVFLCQ